MHKYSSWLAMRWAHDRGIPGTWLGINQDRSVGILRITLGDLAGGCGDLHALIRLAGGIAFTSQLRMNAITPIVAAMAAKNAAEAEPTAVGIDAPAKRATIVSIQGFSVERVTRRAVRGA
jgi:hypothetical protein